MRVRFLWISFTLFFATWFAICWLAMPALATDPFTDTVMTDKGAVQGALLSGGVFAFLGIPYAAPPVGALRFRPPVDALPWTGVLQATVFGPVCPRLNTLGAVIGSENCLTLDVWAPAAEGPHPVIVSLISAESQASAQGFTTLDVNGEQVLIYRDEFGVPHIFADSNRGLFEGYGYAIAQDRLWQLELFRRAARGQLAEILGTNIPATNLGSGTPGALAIDLDMRTRFYTEDELNARYALHKEAANTCLCNIDLGRGEKGGLPAFPDGPMS